MPEQDPCGPEAGPGVLIYVTACRPVRNGRPRPLSGTAVFVDGGLPERQDLRRRSGKIVRTRAVCRTAEGDKTGLYTTVVAAAVFVAERLPAFTSH